MPPSGDDRIVSRFLMTFLADRAEGRRRTLVEYLATFPEHEATIAREYLLQLDHVAEPSPDSTTATPDELSIGPYRLLREIGRGGQGIVHLAEDTRLGRRVAVKVLLPREPGARSDALRRFQREAATAARLDHPDICAVHDVGADGDRVYLAMRYVEGLSLAACLAGARARAAGPTGPNDGAGASSGGSGALIAALGGPEAQSIARTLSMVERVARALHAAHESGVVHRDVKPANVMITPGGDPVVLDFGLARPDESPGPAVTRTGDVLGTPAYMSPEQLAGLPGAVDRRTDVWSLGVVLFECLTLRRPFEGPADFALADAIRLAPVPSVSRFNRGASHDLNVVVATAIERDLLRRYTSALAFAEDLRRLRLHEPISARPAGPMLRLRRWVRRSPMIATLLVLVFMSLSGGLAASLHLLGERGAALDSVLRLSDSARIEALSQREAALWPIGPEIVAGCDSWLEDASALLRNRALHEGALAAVRARGGKAPAHAPRPDAERRNALEKIARGDEIPRQGMPLSWSERMEARRQLAAIDSRTLWIWPDEHVGWMAEVLAGIVASYGDIETLVREIEDRRTRSRTLIRRTIGDEDAAWRTAAAEVASAAPYRGLVLLPQRGLVPLHADKRSGLWEFWAAETGSRPIWDDDREAWQIGERGGIVLVLVPGAVCVMGSSIQDEHPDPFGEDNEGPIVKVPLDPFFISKYELTQGQWMHLGSAHNPAFFRPAPGSVNSLAHPVESVSADACAEVLRRVGLALPTEAQWEHACRAGSTTPWFPGARVRDLAGFANVADARRFDGSDRELDDGWLYTAPVGTFGPNAFGLHDVHGNVWEWCRDPYERTYGGPGRPGDGLRAPVDDGKRVARGGAYDRPAVYCRSAKRARVTRSAAEPDLGVRPVRVVEGPP